jgi:hypothetical protein
MKKQELIEKLKAAGTVASNVFIPVSDVIKMVEDLETESSSDLSDDFISDVAQEIVYQLDRSGKDVISSYDIDADVSGNNIEVSMSDISFDSYEIESIVEGAFETIRAKNEESKQEENNQ